MIFWSFGPDEGENPPALVAAGNEMQLLQLWVVEGSSR